MPTTSLHNQQNKHPADEAPCSKNILTGFQKTADDMMVRKYTPAGVVVNESMDIEHFRGRQVKDFGIGISTKDQKKYLKDFSG